MNRKLIDADELRREMFHKCIETDEEIEKGRAKWESGLWIRYKVFEDAIEQLASFVPDAEDINVLYINKHFTPEELGLINDKIINDDVWIITPNSDVVEVVRCKDCVHLEILNGSTYYARCRWHGRLFESFGRSDTRKWFCADGERRTE